MESQQTQKRTVSSTKASEERQRSPERTGSPKRTTSPSKRTTSPSKRATGGVSPPPTSRGRTTSPVSIRQNFSDDAEREINKLINLLMVGGYNSIAMAAFFDRDEVGLYGVAHFAK